MEEYSRSGGRNSLMGLGEVVCIFGTVHTHTADAKEPLRTHSTNTSDFECACSAVSYTVFSFFPGV